MGIPLGRLADRTNRTRLLAVCLGFWSIMTFTTGLARNFTQVFMARVGVGIGEAGCAPAAHSLIGDYFPAHRRAIGISLFQAGRSEEHTSELQSLMRISYAVFCLKKNTN